MTIKEFKGLIECIKRYMAMVREQRLGRKKDELFRLYNEVESELNNGYWRNDISEEMKKGLLGIPNGTLYNKYIKILKGIDDDN